MSLQEAISKAEAIKAGIAASEERIKAFEETAKVIEQRIQDDLKPPAEHALTAVTPMLRAMEALRNLEGNHKEMAFSVDECKQHGAEATERFKVLHEKAEEILDEANKLVADVAAEVAVAKSRTDEAAQLHDIAESARSNAEHQQQNAYSEARQAQSHVREQKEALSRAKAEKEKLESERRMRNVFTLGLGELFDWGDINANIDRLKNNVRKADEEFKRLEQRIQRFNEEASQAASRRDEYTRLESTLHDFKVSLQSQLSASSRFQGKSLECVRHASEASRVLDELSAASDAQRAAEQFVNSIIAIDKAMNINQLTQFGFIKEPGAVQKGFELMTATPNLTTVSA